MSIRLTRRAALVSSVATGAALPSLAHAQTAPAPAGEALAEAVDAYVKQCLAAFPDQPAVSVAVVKDGAAVLARGYGVRKQGEAARADEHTVFAIASNTKNVTAAALAMMVDEGKVKWDEPVKTYLPGFTLSDPVIGERITVRDTLSHRAGFGLGAGRWGRQRCRQFPASGEPVGEPSVEPSTVSPPPLATDEAEVPTP